MTLLHRPRAPFSSGDYIKSHFTTKDGAKSASTFSGTIVAPVDGREGYVRVVFDTSSTQGKPRNYFVLLLFIMSMHSAPAMADSQQAAHANLQPGVSNNYTYGWVGLSYFHAQTNAFVTFFMAKHSKIVLLAQQYKQRHCNDTSF